MHGSKPVVDYLFGTMPLTEEESASRANRMMETPTPGVLLAWTVTCTEVRQVGNCCGKRCCCALSAEKYLHHRSRHLYGLGQISSSLIADNGQLKVQRYLTVSGILCLNTFAFKNSPARLEGKGVSVSCVQKIKSQPDLSRRYFLRLYPAFFLAPGQSLNPEKIQLKRC